METASYRLPFHSSIARVKRAAASFSNEIWETTSANIESPSKLIVRMFAPRSLPYNCPFLTVHVSFTCQVPSAILDLSWVRTFSTNPLLKVRTSSLMTRSFMTTFSAETNVPTTWRTASTTACLKASFSVAPVPVASTSCRAGTPFGAFCAVVAAGSWPFASERLITNRAQIKRTKIGFISICYRTAQTRPRRQNFHLHHPTKWPPFSSRKKPPGIFG